MGLVTDCDRPCALLSDAWSIRQRPVIPLVAVAPKAGQRPHFNGHWRQNPALLAGACSLDAALSARDVGPGPARPDGGNDLA